MTISIPIEIIDNFHHSSQNRDGANIANEKAECIKTVIKVAACDMHSSCIKYVIFHLHYTINLLQNADLQILIPISIGPATGLKCDRLNIYWVIYCYQEQRFMAINYVDSEVVINLIYTMTI